MANSFFLFINAIVYHFLHIFNLSKLRFLMIFMQIAVQAEGVDRKIIQVISSQTSLKVCVSYISSLHSSLNILLKQATILTKYFSSF